MGFKANCNFMANGVVKNKGDSVSEDEAAKIGVAGAKLLVSEGDEVQAKAPRAPEADEIAPSSETPAEDVSEEDHVEAPKEEPEPAHKGSGHHHSGKKHHGGKGKGK